MFCVVLHAMMLQTGTDFVGVMHETRVGDAILDLEQEGHFVSNMKSKYPYLLHLLCCYYVVIFVQILDLATSGNIRHLCGICKKAVKSNQQGICCDLGEIWFHTRSSCLNMTEETYKVHSENINLQWSCNQCSDLQRDNAELNSTENQPFMNDGFSDIVNSLHQHPGLNVGHLNTKGLRENYPRLNSCY